MECFECQEMTKLYIDDLLPEAKFMDYYAHLETCSTCKEDLYINYAINTALRQLTNEQELSSDFVAEVNGKLAASKRRILRGHKLRIFRRVAVGVEIIGIGLVLSIFTPNERNYAFLPEGSESNIVIEYYGIPGYKDPVMQAIYRYNDEVIAGLKKIAQEKEGR
ncbi:MAG: hypothetical protein MJ064_01435 [Lachnospiraceae bacterium]|nr:hypothetical protein [Lachnospiraceae bacterium]